ncbi:MAG: hypothetical protein SCH66_00175 [Methanolobus sp.]|nr:hypothetical protein [Methanolobus sp.]
MKDTFKQFIEFRKQAKISADFYVAQELIRKLTPEQMDRLLRISPHGEKKQDFHW